MPCEGKAQGYAQERNPGGQTPMKQQAQDAGPQGTSMQGKGLGVKSRLEAGVGGFTWECP